MALTGNESATIEQFAAMFRETKEGSQTGKKPITYKQILNYMYSRHKNFLFPQGYTRLDYVESDGSQYFDTEIHASSNVNFVLDAQVDPSVTSGNHHILSGSNNSNMIILRLSSNISAFSIRWGNKPLVELPITGSIYDRHRFYCEQGIFGIDDGEKIDVAGQDFLISENLFLFGLNLSGKKTQGTKMRVYSLRINDGDLYRFFVPCVRNSDGTIGFYDLANGVFSTIEQTTYLNPGRPVLQEVPSDYTVLDYIESSGTQYINTGVYGNQTTRVRGKFYTLSDDNAGSNSGFVGYGSYENSASKAYGCFSWDKQYEVNYGNTYKMVAPISVGDTIEIDQNQNNLSIILNNQRLENISYTQISFTTPTPLYLMGHGGSSIFGGKQRCYYFDIIQSGKFVKSFIPVKKKSDSSLGFFNIIGQELYLNAGSGQFISGSEVSHHPNNDLDNRALKISQARDFYNNVLSASPYTYLDYIEATGTQAINTQYIPQTNTRLVMDVQMTSLVGEWKSFYGERRSGTLGDQFALYSNSGLRYRSNYGSDSGLYGGASSTSRIVVDQTGPTVKIDGLTVFEHPQTTILAVDSLFLFAVNSGGNVELPMQARLYSCKIYTGDKLERNFLPVKKKVTGEVGLLDTVENVFYSDWFGNSFIGGPEKIAIPSEYTRLEYIQNSGTQYILTDYYPNQDTQVECEFWVDNIYGGIDQNYQPVFGSSIQYNQQAYEFWSQAYGFTAYDNQEFILNTGVVAQRRNVVRKNKNVVTVNSGQSFSFNYVAFTSPLPMIIFGTNRVNQGVIVSTQGANLRIYYLEIKENDLTVHNFIPVKRNSDGKLGLYDTITKDFLTNSGTEDFIAGAEI